jgi:hypothetical protein
VGVLEPATPPLGLASDVPLSPWFDAAVRTRWARGPVVTDMLGERSAVAVVDLHAALAGDAAFRAFADRLEAVIEAFPEDDDANLVGPARIAREAGVDDAAGRAIAFLIGERSTSCAGRSRFALAMIVAASTAFAVPENGALDRSPRTVAEDGRRLAADHRDALEAFFTAQRTLTAALTAQETTVTLARGVRLDDPPSAGADVPVQVRSLESWTTTLAAARGLANGLDALKHGGAHVRILVAKIAVERLMSTSATGLGSPYEYEVVLTGGASGDRCHVIS